MTKIAGYYTRKEAADRLGLSVVRLIQLRSEGTLVPSLRLGNMVLYSQAALDAFIAGRQPQRYVSESGERLLTIAEAAQALGVTKEAIHDRLRSGTLKAVRQPWGCPAGFRYLIPESSIR